MEKTTIPTNYIDNFKKICQSDLSDDKIISLLGNIEMYNKDITNLLDILKKHRPNAYNLVENYV